MKSKLQTKLPRTNSRLLWAQFWAIFETDTLPRPELSAMLSGVPDDIRTIALHRINNEPVSERELARVRQYRHRKADTLLNDHATRFVRLVDAYLECSGKLVNRNATQDSLKLATRRMTAKDYEPSLVDVLPLEIDKPLANMPIRRNVISPPKPIIKAKSWTLPIQDTSCKLYLNPYEVKVGLLEPNPIPWSCPK